MLKEMMNPKCKGNTLTVNLSRWGYPNYIVKCTYHFVKCKGKYSLSMCLCNSDVEDRMRLSSKKVDAQYIPGTRETIIENICRIIHQAATVPDKDGIKYFDKYVE